MKLDNWDDIRTALAVAQNGTVSGAAEALGVHHATVIRRVDALEARLGTRLFQRHPRGYTPTEAGQILLHTARSTDERFAQMASQIVGAGQRIEGDLIITSLPGLSPLVMPRLTGLLQQNPGLRLRYLTDERLYRLDAGEAHVAIRAGAKPTEPDYIPREFARVEQAIYASPEYLKHYGPIEGSLHQHRFALPGPEGQGAPLTRWLTERIPASNIIMISNDMRARMAVIRAGLAIGPLSEPGNLIKAMSLPEWSSVLWLVTHVDLHRTPKVQAALHALRAD